MLVPLAVAVPWLAAEATATLVAAPPPRLSVIGLALLLAATVALTALAIGIWAPMTSVYAREPVALTLSVAVMVRVDVPPVLGVPLMTPVEVFRLRPAGRVPAVMA